MYFVAVADVNGDGKPDLIGINGSVAVLLGNGDGTFQPVMTFSEGGSQPFLAAVADVNGDGKLDLVVANSVSLNVSVLLGNGDGTFQPPVVYATGGSAWTVAVGDMNGDGKPDIVVSNNGACYGCGGSGSVGILLGNGDGTFQPVALYSSGGSNGETSPSFVALADLNRDGKLDVAVSSSKLVSVLLGNGDGTLKKAKKYHTAGSSGDVAIADVNGDGILDLLVVNGGGCAGKHCKPGSVGVLLGKGDGTFRRVSVYSSGVVNSTSVAVGDLNGDGIPDLAVANFCSPAGCSDPGEGSVSVLLGNGGGTFTLAAIYSAGGYWGTFSSAVADLNGDGLLDIVLADFVGSENGGAAAVLLNDGN